MAGGFGLALRKHGLQLYGGFYRKPVRATTRPRLGWIRSAISFGAGLYQVRRN